MSVLIVAAHPDDEVLGCGATAAALATRGVPVRAAFLSGQADARSGRPDLAAFHAQVREASRALGMGEPILGSFPNLAFNTAPHLDLVRFVEDAIRATEATTVFTHHPHDLNDDHRFTSAACQAAARLSQRRAGLPALKGLYYMEVPSSTDWAFPAGSPPFAPDAFFEVGEAGVLKKIAALKAYEGVMRPYPHPRSEEVIRGLAACRGAQAGMCYAEAFQTAFAALDAGRFGG